MSDNKQTVRRLLDATNSHDEQLLAKTIDEVFAPDVLVDSPLPLDVTGTQAIRRVYATLHQAFPDLRITIDDLIEEDDKVVSRQTVTGTHRGEYLGLAATGRTVTYREIFALRFADGRIAETTGVVDVASQMKQLGL